jgi:hypothetical protein
MNSHAQGSGPYFHNVRGRLFLTAEVPSPINPFPTFNWQEGIDHLIIENLSQYPLHEELSAPPLNGTAPITSQLGFDLNTIRSQLGLISPHNDPPIPDWLLYPSAASYG